MRKVWTIIKAPGAQGKVRDIYDLGDKLLLVATDRISAYDAVLPAEIPYKGEILTQMSLYWLGRFRDVCPNHLISAKAEDWPPVGLPLDYLRGRAMLVKKAEVIPFECVVRGYLSGSAWREYERTGAVAGEKLPAGLRAADKLPRPLFTPAVKAASGHDENISEAEMERRLGTELTRRLREYSLTIYTRGAAAAAERGVIIADTKFEFGLIKGEVHLIDEVLTPDSSRFWPSSSYRPGGRQASFDKQYVRDYLDAVGWDHQPPPPPLPPAVIAKTSQKYIEAYELITGRRFKPASG